MVFGLHIQDFNHYLTAYKLSRQLLVMGLENSQKSFNLSQVSLVANKEVYIF